MTRRLYNIIIALLPLGEHILCTLLHDVDVPSFTARSIPQEAETERRQLMVPAAACSCRAGTKRPTRSPVPTAKPAGEGSRSWRQTQPYLVLLASSWCNRGWLPSAPSCAHPLLGCLHARHISYLQLGTIARPRRATPIHPAPRLAPSLTLPPWSLLSSAPWPALGLGTETISCGLLDSSRFPVTCLQPVKQALRACPAFPGPRLGHSLVPAADL